MPISASASVSSGTVTNVAFFAGATKLGAAQVAPFSFTATGLAAGNYALTAVATAAGVSATSTVVNITVTPLVPAVSITNLVNGATFTAPATVPISASASVSSGTVTNVAFFAGASLLGSAQVAPFSFTALNLGARNCSLTAVATAVMRFGHFCGGEHHFVNPASACGEHHQPGKWLCLSPPPAALKLGATLLSAAGP